MKTMNFTRSTIRVLHQARRRFLPVLPALACLIAPAFVQAQSTAQLRTLFFDPVYIDDAKEILLSSGDRPGIISSDQPQAQTTARLPSEIIEDIRRYEENINRQIENSGIYDTGLSQEYLSTGNLYEQLGDIENAINAYDNAMHINRVNEGLYTLSQVDAVRALIAIHKEARNFAEVDKYHEYLYYLMSRNLEPDSEAFNEASLEWAEWNLEAFRRMAFMNEEGLDTSPSMTNSGARMLQRGDLVAIEDQQFSQYRFVPRSALLSNADPILMQSYTADQLIDPRLSQNEDLYDRLLEANGSDAELLKKKANLTWLYKKQLEEYIGTNSVGTTFNLDRLRLIRSLSPLRQGYAEIREDMLALAEELENDNPMESARLYITVADWDLEFSRQSRAYNMYDKAREILLEQDLSESQVSEFISPEPALLIPEYVSHEYTREFQNIPETRDIPYIGFIDVMFQKRANGRLRRIDIVNSSENTTQPIRRRLLDMLENAVMRPAYMSGETVEQSDIKVRYYYSY